MLFEKWSAPCKAPVPNPILRGRAKSGHTTNPLQVVLAIGSISRARHVSRAPSPRQNKVGLLGLYQPPFAVAFQLPMALANASGHTRHDHTLETKRTPSTIHVVLSVALQTTTVPVGIV